MPGLNQLKQFTEDMLAVGDETKIRASRGEKVSPISLPKGIPEADDSDDFIIGLPTKENAEAAANAEKENFADADISDILGENSSDSGLESILNPTDSADEDALAEFLNESPSFTEDLAPISDDELSLDDLTADKIENGAETAGKEDTPLEDMDLDSLLGDIDLSAGGENLGNFDNLDNPENLGNFDDLLGSPDDIRGNADSQPSSGDEINLNEDIPPSVLENDGLPPENDALSSNDVLPEDGGGETDDFDLGAVNPDSLNTDSLNSDSSDSAPEIDLSGFGDLGAGTTFEDLSDGSGGTDSLDLGNFDIDSMISGEAGDENPLSDPLASSLETPETPSSTDDFVPPAGSASSEPSATADTGFDFSGMEDFGGFGSTDAAAASDISFGEPSESAASAGENLDMSSFNIEDMISGDDSPSSSVGEIPNAFDDVPDTGEQEISVDDFSAADFDTSGMEGVDFGKSGDEFPTTEDTLGNDDDFELDSSFEIPGFSDTETADLGKKKPLLDTVDFSQGKEARPKNSLTDEEYVQFKKNLANYPLNLRIAIEDFIARDEFTDEVVFEIIEKVLKKTSARQLATQLEKILDVSINIPRDFEKRSFAEYEAYKQSFQYQLKNRIIPAAIAGVILAFVCFGLFKAGEHFIYKPVMANIHYKQGYTLLEANEFPQSEDEFKEAVSFRPVKKWFFKYAQGYRGKKQYERAGNMYKNILRFFNHDKQAGIEYAEMELYDRANYERAEEIARREVLDYHINDADGILLLGDIFLEWAEVDPEKYEAAKQQYLDLMQRYGSNNVYLSRMLRYFIRTDRLRDVLTYKNMLYQQGMDKKNLKTLDSKDWTELSGYLLEKLYGVLSKNDEYLRSSIEDVLALLNLAVKSDSRNPVARYNLARYYIHNGNMDQAKIELERSLDLFSAISVRTKKNVYREINATRTLGELYADTKEYLKAQTVYTRGIDLYNEEHENSGLEGDENTGKLFADMADLDYFISGNVDDALYNYEMAVKTKNDTPSINYRIGAIYYNKKNYDDALSSFLKVSEKEPSNSNLLLSLGNVLSLRGDNFAAESYYSDLLHFLDSSRDTSTYLLPQQDSDDFELVDLYLKANNNLGVTLYRLARQTGDSNKNAESIVRLSDSMRAYDALTRNPETMIRLEGSNLAAQNSKYITHPLPDFEPAIYTDIPRLLSGEKGLE